MSAIRNPNPRRGSNNNGRSFGINPVGCVLSFIIVIFLIIMVNWIAVIILSKGHSGDSAQPAAVASPNNSRTPSDSPARSSRDSRRTASAPDSSRRTASDEHCTLQCHGPDECYLEAVRQAQHKRYGRAAPCYQEACDMGHVRSCAELGDLYLNESAVPDSHEDALSILKRSCDLNEGAGCYLQAKYLAKFFPDAPNLSETTRELMQRGCDLETVAACSDVSEKLMNAGEYDRGYRYASKGCSYGDTMSCIYRVILSIKRGSPIHPVEARLKYLKPGCEDLKIAEACYLYAMDLPESSPDDKQTWLDRACELEKNGRFCSVAATFRERQNGSASNRDATVMDLEDSCSRDDNQACLRLGQYYANHPTLSRPARYKRAMKVYEDLCKKRDAKGCQEFHRIRKLVQ